MTDQNGEVFLLLRLATRITAAYDAQFRRSRISLDGGGSVL